MNKSKFQFILIKTWKAFRFAIPIIFSVLLIVAFLQSIIPMDSYKKIFSGNLFLDPFIAAVFGSISIGNPIVSYVIGDSLLKNGVGYVAITAFIVSWVTVGIIQIPAEAYFLGKRFALIRNLISFIGAILIGIVINYVV